MTEEKGVRTLLAAWLSLGGYPLKLVGDGPLAEVVKEATTLPGLEWLGQQPREQVLSLMQRAKVLVFPSTWYEGLPMTLVEAFGVGLPVVASDLGSMASVVSHGRTGLLFAPGDPGALAAQVGWSLAHPQEVADMRREARLEYEAKYTAEKNYPKLLEIYQAALRTAKSAR